MGNILTVDVETGGLRGPESNGLCSVALKVYGKDIHEHFLIKPDPNKIYDQGAFDVNGFTLEKLEQEGITKEEAVQRILVFMHKNFKELGYIQILGQNTIFDLEYLDVLFKEVKKITFRSMVSRTIHDTKSNTHYLRELGVVPREISASLGPSYKFYTGKDPVNEHDALGDILLTEEIFKIQTDKNFLLEKLQQ